MTKPLVYLVLGASGSGRREVLADLVSDASEEGLVPVTFLADSEAPSEHDAKLGNVVRWAWVSGQPIAAKIPRGTSTVFFISDGRQNPVDQVEAFRGWLSAQDAELGRILCVVNCQFAHREPGLLPWYDACIHFADVVLLNRRTDIPNKWMSDFLDRYASQYFPCLFEMLKGGRVKNPAMILEPQARRISQAFEEGAIDLPEGTILLDEEGEDEEDDEKGRRDEDEGDTIAEDPYFQRRPGGRRVREIPDIRSFDLPKA